MSIDAPRMSLATPTGATAATTPLGKAEPTSPKPVETKKNDSIGKNEFLKMLVAQMRHQDPLNPMDGQQMAAQMAQFSTVEQLMAMNASATEQKAAQQAIATAIEALGKAQADQQAEVTRLIQGQSAAAMVGKVGVLPGNQLLVGRDGDGVLMYGGAASTGPGRVIVKDALGRVVSEASATVRPGEQQLSLKELEWTPPLAPGQYQYAVELRPAGGAAQPLTTFTAGRITGMRIENGSPMLVIADTLRVPMTGLSQLRG
jgi:flagellar basal-body rod modification protein FlgD